MAHTQPLHFLERIPLEDLVGGPVAAAQFKAYDYRDARRADPDRRRWSSPARPRRRHHRVSVRAERRTDAGAARRRRGSADIRIAFAGTGAPQNYQLAGARAYDVGAAIVVADHSPGWGLGSHAFVGGGRGRIRSDTQRRRPLFRRRRRRRQSGPFGVELSVKFAWNHLSDPVDHHFLTVPDNAPRHADLLT